MQCRVCGATIDSFMSFGEMPIANGFLAESNFANEYFYELAPAYCENCTIVQITEQPDPRQMFHEEYAFFTRTSSYMVEHFHHYAQWVMENHVENEDPFIVELGSNDGALLEYFAKREIRHLGIEPSLNVANEAKKYHINCLVDFFSENVAEKICLEFGQADVIMAANVMCHIPDLHAVAQGVCKLLKPNGVLIFEDPYLGDVIKKTSFDQFYDEHVYMFSINSVSKMFSQHGLELIDVTPQTTHGGSMRYVLSRKGERNKSASLNKHLEYENSLGLRSPSVYQTFKQKCERHKEQLLEILTKKQRDGNRVVGYAATSKSTTVLNYCNIGPDLIEYISDTTPLKHGKFTPGSHIPVRAYDQFTNNYPDYAVLFAWNHEKEIINKETNYRMSGGKWITFVPDVRIEG